MTSKKVSDTLWICGALGVILISVIKTLALLAFFFQLSTGAASLEKNIFDWDDTLMKMNAPTYIYHKTTGAERAITSEQLAHHQTNLGISGEFKDYQIIPEKSYREFRAAIYGKQSFKQQVIEALGKGEDFWKAAAFQDFASLLSDPKRVKDVYVLTARGHLQEEILDGLAELQRRGLIKHIPPIDNLMLAMNYTLNPAKLSAEEYKAQQITRLLDELPSGGTLHFLDDSGANVDKTLERLQLELKKNPTRWNDKKILVEQVLTTKRIQHTISGSHGLVSKTIHRPLNCDIHGQLHLLFPNH
jgi:hypothetical protein